MLVKDFKEAEGYRYNESLLSSFPSYCLDYRCNFPTEITETLTSLRCSNPRCPSKIARRLIAMMSIMGVKDLGGARANDFVSKFQVTNPLIIFAYEPDEDGALGFNISMDVSKKISSQVLSKNSFTLWEYVRLANLPFIQTSALQIFGDYDDLELAYKDIEEGGVEFIRNKLSIKKGDKRLNSTEFDDGITNVSIRAIKVYESLMTFKEDLFFGLPYVNIIKIHQENMTTFKVVCSDEVGSPFKTKADFYATVNNLYPDIHVEFLTSVTKSIDYLVWAGADKNVNARVTNKVQKVRKYNEQYEVHKSVNAIKDGEHYIPIVTAAEFLAKLELLEKNKSIS